MVSPEKFAPLSKYGVVLQILAEESTRLTKLRSRLSERLGSES